MITELACSGGKAIRRQVDPKEPLAGPWRLEISTADIGQVRTLVDVETSGTTFEAHSREGAASDFLGWFQLLLAKIFTDYFENGSLIHFVDGKMKGNDSISAVFVSALGDMRFDGRLGNGRIDGVLKQKGRIRGHVVGTRDIPAMLLDDYPRVIESAIDVAEVNFYRSETAKQKEWRSFKSKIRDAAGHAQDDIDMTFSFFTYARDLPFSHFYLFRKPPTDMTFDDPEVDPAVQVKELSPSTVQLRIRSFGGGVGPIDSAFGQIIGHGYANLIVDLRGNAGGNISAMRVAEYLTDRSYPGGCFVTRRWFDAHPTPPGPGDTGAFPLLTEANLSLLFDGIHTRNGVRLQVTPSATPYRGHVFFLIDHNTASACEPLVYGVKQLRLGTLVGERTAGKMLNGERFDVGHGWSLTVPTADYYTADGNRLDQTGVQPDVNVKSADALSYVMKLVR
jgi:hypothetical protein